MKLLGLSKTYTSKTKDIVLALNDISLSFNQGLTFILGKSGSGKTTLLNIIGGFDKATSGKVLYDSYDMSKLSSEALSSMRRHQIGYYLSDHNLVEHLTVSENIQIVSKLKNEVLDDKYFLYIIKKLEIEELLKRYPFELSTGQRQRVALARLMVKKPSLLLADEPTGSLDNKTATLVLDVLKDMSKESRVIIVSHDEALADKYADRIIILNDGHIESDSQIKGLNNEKAI